ncbi:MAG: Ku protein [Actinomycetota bacterium]
MQQAVWTGTLSFGLVSIPVKLYGATSPRDVRFHQFEGRTGRRVRYRRVADEADEQLWEGPAGGWRSDQEWGAPGPATALPPGTEGAAAELSPMEPTTRPGQREAELGPAGDRQAQGRPLEARPRDEGPAAREVAFEDVVRGYEVDPGRFVRVTAEELEELAPEPSGSIDIEDFVRLADIDPVYFEKSCQVVPAPGSERQYRLLVRAMEESGRVAIGRFVLRTREHLAAIRPWGGALMLETLFRFDEVREPRGLRPAEEPSPREIQMAVRLIEALGREWDPARYPDTYRERVLEMIRGKAGPAPERTLAVEEPAVFDLMEALKRSVEAARRARGPVSEPEGDRPPSSRRGAREKPAGGPGPRRRRTG